LIIDVKPIIFDPEIKNNLNSNILSKLSTSYFLEPEGLLDKKHKK